MKTNFLLYIATIMATTAIAAPAALEAEARDVAEVAADAALLADNCFHRSSCSVSWAGKGEEYCDWRGFSHMTGDGCSWPKKAVCCIVA